jgi:D-arabinose 1-dehydrogenase-like Zn-dependent alcohol dehydrogenase
MMRAVVMRRHGAPEVLETAHVPLPAPGPGEALVHVEAVPVLRTRDLATRAGLPPFGGSLKLPHVLGGEHAGVVAAIGRGVPANLIGRRVAVSAPVGCAACAACATGDTQACRDLALIGVHRQGAYADYCVAPSANVHPIPDDLTAAAAAVLAVTGPVARAQLHAAAVPGDGWVAITGAAGMLGTTLAALARFRGARVVAIVRSTTAAEPLRALGAEVVSSGDPDLTATLREITGDGPAAVIDNLGVPDLWSACAAALAPGGRIVISGALNAAVTLDVRRLYLRNQSIVGVRTGGRLQVAAFWADVREGFHAAESSIAAFPLERAAAAHAALEAGSVIGSAVLAPSLELRPEEQERRLAFA